MRWPARLALAGWVLVYGSLACGGGGGGGGPTEPPPPPPTGIDFTPDSTAGADSVHLAAGSSGSANRFVLEVRASQVTDLYGVSFDLEYPNQLLSWVESATSAGGFLTAGGVNTELLVTEQPAGTLIVGHSRLGEVSGSDGSGVLLTLEFNRAANGSGRLDLENHDALSSAGDVKTGVTWIGGSVDVSL